jgi:multidrug efflux pump subunit AcrA (membrane-fusion protein)
MFILHSANHEQLKKISNYSREMKKQQVFIFILYLCLCLMSGCRNEVSKSEKTATSAIPATVTQIRIAPMSSYLDLSATSSFLFKASVKAPVTGYIENMFINQGDAVENGKLLFSIKTKEASAISGDSVTGFSFKGVVKVNAAVAGLISSIDHPKGDYVAEGDQLCQIAIPGSFVLILDIPYELSG